MHKRRQVYLTLVFVAGIMVAPGIVFPGRAQDPMEQMRQAIEKAKQIQAEAARKAAERRAQQQQQQQQRPGQPGAQPAAGPPAASAQPPLNADVQAALMGPWVSGNTMSPLYLSEDGSHIAIATAKGSRQVMMVDGVEGPLFDEFPRTLGLISLPVALSPTGGRSAYVGRRGQDYIAVVDGKEAGRIATQQTWGGLPGAGVTLWDFWFSHDGSHLAYPVVNDTGSVSMIVDGVKSPTYTAFDLTQTMLKGSRFAYVVQTNDKMWHVVVDNKQGPPYQQISSFMMTPDGAHYAFIANKPGAAVAVVEGVEGKVYQGLSDLQLAANGRIAYMASRPAAANQNLPGGVPAVLVVDGQEILNTRSVNRTIPGGSAPYHNVVFSPDGKRTAYVRQNAPSPGVAVVVDGKAGIEYATIGDLQFSPDSLRYFYMAGTASGNFPVIDGQELPAVTGITDFQFSPDGKRYAFKIWNAAQGGGFSVMVDGKDSPHYGQDISPHSLTFSPDSKHYAYAGISSLSTYSAVVDGDQKPGYNAPWAVTNQANPPISFPPIYFSPDSNHVAYVGQKMDGTGKAAVVLDGVAYEGASSSFSFPSFSPNSKHFAWINTTGKGWTLFVDEKAGPTYETILQNITGCRFIDDHTFRFYGIKDNQVYRVTVDLGG